MSFITVVKGKAAKKRAIPPKSGLTAKTASRKPPKPPTRITAKPIAAKRATRPLPVARTAQRPAAPPPAKPKGILPSLFGPNRIASSTPKRTQPSGQVPATEPPDLEESITTAAEILESEYESPEAAAEVDGYIEEENPAEEETDESGESSMGFELPGSALIKAKTGSALAAPLLYIAVGSALLYWASRIRR
jgi:hypothetical protein